MTKKMSFLMALSLLLLMAGCIPQKNTQPNYSTNQAVKTKTIIVVPVVTGVSTLKLNVRQKGSSKTPVVDVLAKGTQVELLGVQNNWYKIRRTDGTGKQGYAYHKYINLDFGNYRGTKGKNKLAATVFSSPSTKSAAVIKLSPQNNFDIINFKNGYYEVKNKHYSGYIKADKCIADPSSPISKTQTVTINTTIETEKVKKTKSGQCEVPAKKKTASSSKTTPKYKDPAARKKTSSSKHASANTKAKQDFAEAFESIFGISSKSQKNDTKEKSKAQQNKDAIKNNVPVQSENDVYKRLLQQISNSKELARKTVIIREQMLKSLNETRALQSLVGKTVSAMNNDFQIATKTAQGVHNTGMEKISIKAFIKDISYEPTETIEDASVKVAENGKMLKALESKIKTEAANFNKLNDKQLKNLDSIIKSFSNNIHASNALYEFSIDKSNNVILGIDRAINAYDEKAGDLAIEATKQAGILTLAGVELAGQIANIQNDPFSAIFAVARLIEMQDELTELICLFKDFKADYDYIENNSGLISEQGKRISRIIMTARRKNTQVTTMLESYYAKKLKLSSRLKKKLISQTADGYKAVEEKAASVAIAEDLLD